MKFLITLLILVAGSSFQAHSRTEKTETSVVCGHIIQFLGEYSDAGLELPKSFDDMPSVAAMIKDSPGLLAHINALAVVPDAPLIGPANGVQGDYQGYRVFAIGRFANRDYGSQVLGRYAILLNKDESGGLASWIPEPQAEAILHQIGNFRPERQPLAFSDFTSQSRKLGAGEAVHVDQQAELERRGLINRAIASYSKSDPMAPLFWFAKLICGCAFIILLVGLARRTSKTSDK